jgi:DNA-binding MarR family transcriptional regulator
MAEKDLRLQRFMPYRLSVATNLVSSVIANAYQQLFGLSIPEWRLVAVLAEGDELNQQAIGVATRMDKLTVSRAAIALDHRRLVARRRDPADGRAQLLRLSQPGRELYAAVAPKALELEQRIFAGFTAQELTQLEAVLTRIETAALAVAAETTQR